jgi:hypothetical protein
MVAAKADQRVASVQGATDFAFDALPGIARFVEADVAMIDEAAGQVEAGLAP